MSRQMTFLHCVCLTIYGAIILALAPGLSGVPPENANARDKGQVKSASRLVTSPDNQVARKIDNQGSVASGALMELKWLDPQGSAAPAYPAGTSGVDTADLTIPGAGPNGQTLWLGVFFSAWDGQGGLTNVQGTMDSGALPAGLSVLRLACPGDDDGLCTSELGTGGSAGCNVPPINDDTCSPAFQDLSRADVFDFSGVGPALGIFACAIATDDLACGANRGPGNDVDGWFDPGGSFYLATMVLSASQSLTGGPHSVDLIAPNGSTFMNDSLFVLKISSATLTIETGSCCFGIAPGQDASCEEDVSRKGCAGRKQANSFRTVNLCPANGGPACCECFKTGQPDPACADEVAGKTGDNACTDNFCDNNCSCQNPNIPGWDKGSDCCDPVDGSFTAIDDGDSCTDDSCSLDGVGPGLGVAEHDNSQAGTPCDDGNACTHTDLCGDKDGLCTGDDINDDPCNINDDCDALIRGTLCCEGTCGCSILSTSSFFPTSCCLADGGCEPTTCPAACKVSGGRVVVAACQGDGNGNGVDDACESPIVIPPGDDCWRTECGRTQFNFCNQPIPADFFGTGSLPYAGVLELGGKEGSPFDTSIRRLQEMALDPPPSVDSTPIELVALNLKSCQEITVDYSDSTTENWDVDVELSLSGNAPPLGSLSVRRTHNNGGVFTAEFFVQPVFKFTRVGDLDPSNMLSLDTGALGIPPALLGTFGEAPYVHQLEAGSTVFTCGTNFAPGVEEDPETGDQCCRKVGHAAGPPSPTGHIHETAPPDCTACPIGACCNTGDGSCTLAQGAGDCIGDYKGDGTDCRDTDGDGLADVLESGSGCGACPAVDLCNLGTDPGRFDTDDDGCSDGEEVSEDSDPCDSCDFLASCVSLVSDCDNNGVPDRCDILAGNSDSNNNGIVDECEPTACCFTSQGTPVCQNLTDAECFDVGGVRQPIGLLCPTERIFTAGHGSGPFTHLTDPAQQCPAGIAIAGGGCIPGDPIDPWKTAPDAEMCHIFGLDSGACPPGEPNCSPPIPADFFAPGSDPYGSPAPEEVCLKGEPLGPVPPFGEFGEADTLIRRTGGPEGTGDPFNRCDLPSGKEHTVTVEVVALNLVSTAPITVTFNGGQNPEQWDVAVDLSQTSPDPPGSITAVKTHCNGGTYDSELHVQPRFTFTKVGDPGQVRVLDTGLEDIPFVTLTQEDAQWTSDIAENFGWPSEICTDFHPGVEGDVQTTDCDCNSNGTRDQCDVERESLDCNGNGLPDECEIDENSTAPGGPFFCATGCDADCNKNGIPDECDIEGEESPDCNGNGVPDECELTDNDCNVNGIPDDCEKDCNGNGLPDVCEIDENSAAPGGPFFCATGCDPDCNNNGIPDECDDDCNQNDVPDDCDVDDGDPDGNGLVSVDCNGNDRPDECDIRSGASGDCNGNGVPDECDIAAGFSADLDGNGIPDECQARGACCDPSDGMCEDDFPLSACQPPEVWHEGVACAVLDDQCRVRRGACCNSSPLAGDCRDDALESDCASENEKWFRNARCAETDCVANQIPTVSEWGLVILTLLLLTGGKIYFGHRRVPV